MPSERELTEALDLYNSLGPFDHCTEVDMDRFLAARASLADAAAAERDPTPQTRGWEPTCQCNAGEPLPCTVLDCFSGSGTTGMAATELGRNYIGIELNPEYAAMSEKRIWSWRVRDVERSPEPLPGQRELFA